jgi:hypothetical protein
MLALVFSMCFIFFGIPTRCGEIWYMISTNLGREISYKTWRCRRLLNFCQIQGEHVFVNSGIDGIFGDDHIYQILEIYCTNLGISRPSCTFSRSYLRRILEIW